MTDTKCRYIGENKDLKGQICTVPSQLVYVDFTDKVGVLDGMWAIYFSDLEKLEEE